ncbi:MAG: glycosyltransferase [Chloroflexota bacterium]|nr:glycosyltransferase [Chloroflexota bacterium]
MKNTSPAPHVLMVTNHGVHQWQIIPGLPDTGGQNVFVNQFTAALAQLGFRVTIVNRGGYPDPSTGELRAGYKVKDFNQRILYLDDGLPEFVRKEDMHERLPALAEALTRDLQEEVDLIISHYWDGAALAAAFNAASARHVPHYWVPHSLGRLKKRNVSAAQWYPLRIEERIAVENDLIPQLDGIAATSATIQQSLLNDYGYRGPSLFLPPCVDTDRFHPRPVSDDNPIWKTLADLTGYSTDQVRSHKIVTEISRTDSTKRKDVLLRAFSRARRSSPACILIVAIDDRQAALADSLHSLMDELGLAGQVATVGPIWDLLPDLYAVTDLYCTPSIMEGFGMSAQEAAATAVPVVSSQLVPFATEYLLGANPQIIEVEKAADPLRVGQGAIVVRADDVAGFAHALSYLLNDDSLRCRMGRQAYEITVPYFTWDHMVRAFLQGIAFDSDSSERPLP